MKTRFAPSPTGFLHVGNVRTALMCYLWTRKNKGEFILRFDDTDLERGREEYREAIVEDLQWLGLEYSRVFRQSERLSLYEEARDRLIESGRIYPCFETAEELELMRKSQEARGIPPIYNRQALRLHRDQIAEYEREGRRPHYRFLLEDRDIFWNDGIKRLIKYRGLSFSDPVVFRENGMPMYVFASVVDDVDMGITHIIRGEDHITNTAVQIQMFEAMADELPNFSHIPLIKSADGKISKRLGGFAIRDIRADGLEAISLVNYLSQLGSGRMDIYKNIDDVIAGFDLGATSKSSPFYDYGELKRLNVKYLQSLSYGDVEGRLSELKINDIDEKCWNAVRGNISVLADVKNWRNICPAGDSIVFSDRDREFLHLAAELLPEEIDSHAWDEWVARLKDTSGRKGRELFMPLRLALTGQEHGPELKNLLEITPRNEIIRRLRAYLS